MIWYLHLLSCALLNDGLEHYADDIHVFQISGHMFNVHEFLGRRESLLLPITTTWGWATWLRAWEAFDATAQGWERLAQDREFRRRFNLYDYAHKLERQISGQRQSWGIKWYWSVFSRGGLSCFPPCLLVANTGMDGSGTHGRGRLRSFESGSLPDAPLFFLKPLGDTFEPEAWGAVKRAIWRQNGRWLGYFVDWLRRIRWKVGGRQ